MNSIHNLNLPNYQKFIRPSASCQACYSELQNSNDCIITCEICLSCIHQTHYGSQLFTPPEKWQCQRCRYFLQNGTHNIVACQFCPNLRGIMKIFTFNNKRIWVHPECATWSYPLIYFVTTKRQSLRHQKSKNSSTYYWAEDYDENVNPCDVCKSSNGYRLKCKYYSCKTSYHVTCARSLGIVRDLESFRIENQGYFPVYCREHIELKIADYKARSKQLKQKGQMQKGNHFAKISTIMVGQLNNLKDALQKYKEEEEMIEQLTIETRKKQEHNANMSFDDISNSFKSEESGQFLRFLEQNMINENLQRKIRQKQLKRQRVNKDEIESQRGIDQPQKPMENIQRRPELQPVGKKIFNSNEQLPPKKKRHTIRKNRKSTRGRRRPKPKKPSSSESSEEYYMSISNEFESDFVQSESHQPEISKKARHRLSIPKSDDISDNMEPEQSSEKESIGNYEEPEEQLFEEDEQSSQNQYQGSVEESQQIYSEHLENSPGRSSIEYEMGVLPKNENRFDDFIQNEIPPEQMEIRSYSEDQLDNIQKFDNQIKEDKQQHKKQIEQEAQNLGLPNYRQSDDLDELELPEQIINQEHRKSYNIELQNIEDQYLENQRDSNNNDDYFQDLL